MMNRDNESDSNDSDREYFRNLIIKNDMAAILKKKMYNSVHYKAAVAQKKRKIDSSTDEEDFYPQKVLRRYDSNHTNTPHGDTNRVKSLVISSRANVPISKANHTNGPHGGSNRLVSHNSQLSSSNPCKSLFGSTNRVDSLASSNRTNVPVSRANHINGPHGGSNRLVSLGSVDRNISNNSVRKEAVAQKKRKLDTTSEEEDYCPKNELRHYDKNPRRSLFGDANRFNTIVSSYQYKGNNSELSGANRRNNDQLGSDTEEEDEDNDCEVQETDGQIMESIHAIVVRILNSVEILQSDVAALKSEMAESDGLTEQEFNGNNLLDSVSCEFRKFSIKVFKKLFTVEERKVGLIIETKTRSERTPLDMKRVSLLRKAVESKFEIASENRSQAWKYVKKICNRHCYDQSKKK